MSTIKMKDNQKCCESEVFRLQNILIILCQNLMKFLKKKTLKESLDRKNAIVSKNKLELENRKNKIHNLVGFLEEKRSTMSDYSLTT